MRLYCHAGIRTPDDLIGSVFDFLAFEQVFAFLVSREIDYAVPSFPHALRNGEEDRIAESTTCKQHIFAVLDFGRRAGRSHDYDRFAGLQVRTEPRRDSQLERDQSQNLRIAVASGSHRLHYITGIERMVIAIVRDKPSIFVVRGKKANGIAGSGFEHEAAAIIAPHAMGFEKFLILIQAKRAAVLLLIGDVG